MDELTRERLDELERLREAATQGEWRSTWGEELQNNWDQTIIAAGDEPVVGMIYYDGDNVACTEPDAAHIAATHNALPALLRAAREHLDWSDPTPISHESLAALKLPCVPGRGFVVNDHFSIFKTRSRGWVLVAGNPSDDSLDSFEVASLTTLGQLRRLLSVLRGAK
jgi:hypothetical protein